ncbi:MAG: bifunctional 2',3'-cyclic-nucleotide 2'-phosphodiesterase/3'-nucleotidase [Oleispira sp.]|nr:bifunctional 2',3'-cyclic-nucleotide 2'-phosphodiesterase/3'-nucleotidase [Oleispira sp.]MBL4881240.1 bifunctional 2',3'-cyclic-nucleotide 2'-phosphodiesterase/3'-nucleotidase [Oleispira sp.]
MTFSSNSLRNITLCSSLIIGLSACGGGSSKSKNNSQLLDVEITKNSSEVIPTIESSKVVLRIMETTDLHANIMNYNYYRGTADDSVGLVKTATLIEIARAEVKNSVLVDNGDLLQGSPLGDYVAKVKGLEENEVHPIYKAMNLLNYDAANIGNHEFNFGLPFLKQAIDDANFPYTSANVFFDDHDTDDSNDIPYFKPYLLQEKNVLDADGNAHQLTIGYIGFVPPQVMQWDKNNLETRVKAKDIVDMAKHYVPMMKADGADIIIAIPHSGLVTRERLGGDENASFYLSQVEGIDAIMFGHAHRNFPGHSSYDDLEGVDNVKGTINGVAAVMPGYWGKYLGYIDLTLEKSAADTWSVVDSISILKPISQTNPDRSVTSLVESHAGIEEAVQHDHELVNTWVSEPFAKISKPINSFFALVQDDPSIQVVTDAQTWYVKTIVQGTDLENLPILSVGAPFRAGRGGSDDFTDLSAGDVSYGNVADLYIYPNTLKVLQLNGAEVKQWLEMSTGQFNTIAAGSQGVELINQDFPSYNFDVIDGIEYEIDVSQAPRYDKSGNLVDINNSRIKNITYQGEPINLGQDFLVVSNNYRAAGGGNFPGISAEKIVIDAPNENRQTVADYLIFSTEENPETGFDPSADNNWSFTPLANTSVVFKGSSKDVAQDFADQNPALIYSHIDTEGYGVYSLNLGLGDL